MPSPRTVVPWCLMVCLGPLGCAALPVLQHVARPDTVTVSPMGEDGTRYLEVEGGPLSSEASVRNRWKVTARRICQGDYIEITESGYTQRTAGIARRRFHEGFIQCVQAEPTEPSTSADAPTLADATDAGPTRRAKRTRRRRPGSRFISRRR